MQNTNDASVKDEGQEVEEEAERCPKERNVLGSPFHISQFLSSYVLPQNMDQTKVFMNSSSLAICLLLSLIFAYVFLFCVFVYLYQSF